MRSVDTSGDFIEQDIGAEVHWSFKQALEALKTELYLPACTSFINVIEPSLRLSLAQINIAVRVTKLESVKR